MRTTQDTIFEFTEGCGCYAARGGLCNGCTGRAAERFNKLRVECVEAEATLSRIALVMRDGLDMAGEAPKPSGPTPTNIGHLFDYHKPGSDQVVQSHEGCRSACRAAARHIMVAVPECAERTLAIRKLEEAMMWANAGIARWHTDNHDG